LRIDGTRRIRDQIVEWNPESGFIVHKWAWPTCWIRHASALRYWE
jgi:hypothetical protein